MKHASRNHSLHYGIRRVVIVCFAMIGFCTLFSVLALSRVFYNELSNSRLELAERYFSQINAFLDSAESTSFQILSNTAIQDTLASSALQRSEMTEYAIARKNLQAFITTAAGNVSSYIRFIAVLDRTGHFYSYGGLVTDVALQEQVNCVLRDVPDNGSILWTSVEYAGKRYIVLARVIRQIANTSLMPLGHEAIYIDVSSLLRKAELNGSNYMDGTEVLLNGDRIFRGADCPEGVPSEEDLGDRTWAIRKYGGSPYLVTCKRFFGGQMVFVNYQKSDRVMGALGRVLWWNVLLLIGVIAFFTAVSLLTIGRQFQRFNKLTEAMKRITPGHFGIELEADLLEADNEVGLFARRFQDLMNRIDDLVNRDLRNKLFIAQAQCRMLRAQIHPHFLYNTLETIHALAKRDGNEQIAKIAMSLSRLARVSYSGEEYTSLQKEIEFVQEYLTIYRARFSDRLKAVIDWDHKGGASPVPQLTLQPLVENSVRYGLMKKPTSGVIRLKIRCRGDRIRISLYDNGMGFPNELIEKYRSMSFEGELELHGFANVLCRLRRAYGDDVRLEIHSKEGCWTNIGIVMPGSVASEEGAHEENSVDR